MWRFLPLPMVILSLLLSSLPAEADRFPDGSRRAIRCARKAIALEALESARERGFVGHSYTRRASRRLNRAIRQRAASLADNCVKLNQLQTLGSHNSYHVQPRTTLLAALLFFDPMFFAWEYTHAPLAEQFSDQKIRQIELDVFYDPLGGLYAFRAGLTVVGDDPFSPLPEMSLPGMKVLHVQDLDFETRCATFIQCLDDVKAWSDAHPNHIPITVLVEVKDDPIPDPVDLGFVTPLPFTAEAFDALDAEIRSVFPDEQLITPDSIRVPTRTLEESVLRGEGWPKLGRARGRVLFALDNQGSKRLSYIAGRPNLEGRVLFTDGIPGEPDAAFIKRNDPVSAFDEIQQLVADGYLVRTRADTDTNEARSGDTTRREAALASGAQLISSDYPVPNPSLGSNYHVDIPGEGPARCNPINAPAGCRDSSLGRH